MNQIKTHSANGRNYLIVQVPKDAYDFEVSENYLCFMHDDYDQQLQDVLLPPGQYTLLFIAEEATEEQAEQGIGDESDVVLYGQTFTYPAFCKEDVNELPESWGESLHSLIRSLFTEWKNYKHVILERHDTDK